MADDCTSDDSNDEIANNANSSKKKRRNGHLLSSDDETRRTPMKFEKCEEDPNQVNIAVSINNRTDPFQTVIF